MLYTSNVYKTWISPNTVSKDLEGLTSRMWYPTWLMLLFAYGSAQECVKKNYGQSSFVCVCNSSYCDLTPSWSLPEKGSAWVVTSSKDQNRFQASSVPFGAIHSNGLAGLEADIFVNGSATFQTLMGFGGAFTDAAGVNIASLSTKTQETLLRSYFAPEGLDYSIGRVPMAGCDFSVRNYTYDDVENDVTLEHFSLTEEDLVYKIPFILQAMKMSSKQIKMFGSPWTAPAWMKSNHDLIGQGHLLEEFYPTWANYFVKFLDAYEAAGVPFWGMTAQNEPLDGNIPDFSFNCMGWTAETQAKFVGGFLGPALRNSSHEQIQLMILDDQRTMLPKWIETVMADTEAAKYVNGIGVHWYVDLETPVIALTRTHELFPDLFVLATEACEGSQPWELEKVMLGSWERAESYAQDIIEDLNHWVTGWVDWNLALDEHGGPNWTENFVDAPIIVNATSDEFYRQPMYYALGHFSKFLAPGSQRVGVETVYGEAPNPHLSILAANDAQGNRVLVILNRASTPVTARIHDDCCGVVSATLDPRSITSVWYGTS